jgi:hypothetical protein
MIRTLGLAIAIAAMALPAGPAAAESPAPDDTRVLMREIFAAFATLVEHVDDPEAFASSAERESLVRAYQTLDRNAHQLENHGGAIGEGHQPVGRSLADDVERAFDFFVIGHFESARFVTAQLAEACFACHSKLPAAHRFELGAKLLEVEPVASLPPERKALLAVAARQFDTALTLFETYFADPSHSAVDVALSGALESYLKVALRVRGEPDRVRATLQRFRQRPDLPYYLGAEVDRWIESLRSLDLAAPGDRLARAREQIDAARAETAYPGDRRGLVRFVVASRWLHEYLGTGDLDPDARAETFLLLGLCEIHISSSLWVSEAEAFLESAIRTAPGSEHARTAYAILEGFFVEGYTGSGGTHLPPEIERRLAELRALVEGTARPTGVSSE